jgi:hypothetical protein
LGPPLGIATHAEAADRRKGLGNVTLDFVGRFVLIGRVDLVEDGPVCGTLGLQSSEPFQVPSRNDSCHGDAALFHNYSGSPAKDLVQ